MLGQNFLSPVEFQFSIKRMPTVQYYVQSINIPSISSGFTEQVTPFRNTYRHGDKLTYDDLFLTIVVDEPYKDFAYELDMASRYKQPPVRSTAGGGEIASEKSDGKRASKFLTNSWKFFALVIYMLMVYVTTEAYSYYAVN